MSTKIVLSYLLLILGVVIWAVLVPGRRRLPQSVLGYITVFGGAFLFASCFINLVPHIFIADDPYRFTTPHLHFKVAAGVMVGFLIQLLLEQVTRGVEHGHNHCPCCEDEVMDHHQHSHAGPCHHATHVHPVTGLIVGLSIHAFLEGMPLVDMDGDIHQGLLYGIVLHNIPIALVMVGLFISNHYSFLRSLSLLTLFAIMTPLGSLCNIYLIPQSETLQSLIMAVVVGILLHVSVSILFDHDHNTFAFSKLALIIIAFIAAYFTPGCPEIYPTF